MVIRKKFLDKTRKEPEAFIYVLQALNNRTENVVSPQSLIVKLERHSNNIISHIAIADYWRKKGVSDEELFES